MATRPLPRPSQRSQPRRRGSIIVLAALMLVVLFALLALAFDLGLICRENARCQDAADAASHAAACVLLANRDDLTRATEAATDCAKRNMPDAGDVLLASDVSFGHWDAESLTFRVNASGPNAVRAVVRRSALNKNPLDLCFAALIGHAQAEIGAEAITTIPPIAPRLQLLVDEETIDSDIPAIEDLARRRGVACDALISDGDGDGWIDLPSGTTLEVPTGQVGDEGIFDCISFEGAFPFQSTTPYTAMDFLAEGTALRGILGTRKLQDKQWKSADAPHPMLVGKKILDPVLGIDPMRNHSDVIRLPDAEVTYVAPVFKSDVSMVERDTRVYGSPAANLQGERRGLLAFQVLSARNNPAGGSYLPLLTIEVLDGNSIDWKELVVPGQTDASLRPKLVK